MAIPTGYTPTTPLGAAPQGDERFRAMTVVRNEHAHTWAVLYACESRTITNEGQEMYINAVFFCQSCLAIQQGRIPLEGLS